VFQAKKDDSYGKLRCIGAPRKKNIRKTNYAVDISKLSMYGGRHNSGLLHCTRIGVNQEQKGGKKL